ncbi:hypothetical protein [Agromyces binzhouensis]|uniref:Uncharacterized protein n=1 Tax=Agromyces binzhouensis TaxID=1817495 RepID=A0A4Q2JWP4_9MICO|nr:hypothetical protein [Agromyces binzhouensis]RXZ51834.1 hypothetical protein ESO86_00335 [Agromyces binzhouensis]
MRARNIGIAGAIIFGTLLGGSFMLNTATASCGGGTINPTTAEQVGPVAGYDVTQLGIAAMIMNSAAKLGLPPRAATIAVMTAMGESSLRNLDHGDHVDNTTIGVFQQGESYGPRADRLNPETAATAFLTRLVQIRSWDTMDPSLAAHTVQINQDPDHYTPYYSAAVEVVNALTSTSSAGACGIDGDATTLAQELAAAVEAGRLRALEPRYLEQITDIAVGRNVPGCGIEIGTLQVIVLAVRTFDAVGISDLNRHCTGSLLGAGTNSSHWTKGGGHAVDFYSLDGHALTGADSYSVRLISMLDPAMPAGARVGQAQCRAAVGSTIAFRNLDEFDDSCNHLHVDLANAPGSLLTGVANVY